MNNTNQLGVLQLRRAMDAAPRRSARATWQAVSQYCADVLDAFGFENATAARKELAAVVTPAMQLLLLRCVTGVRIVTDVFEMDVDFVSGSGESADSLEMPPVIQTISTPTVDFYWCLTSIGDAATFFPNAPENSIQFHLLPVFTAGDPADSPEADAKGEDTDGSYNFPR